MDITNRRLAVLSGETGIGKSTVCRKLAETARRQGMTCGGVISTKAGGLNIVFEDLKTGKREPLAGEAGKYTGPQFGKYSFSFPGLQSGLASIRQGVSEDILFVDELGHLEVRGEGLAEAFEILSGGEANRCVVVIRGKLLDVLLPRFSGHPRVFYVTVENRDTIARDIMEYLLD